MSLFSGLGGYLFGVPPVSSTPYSAQAQQLQQDAGKYAGQEQSAYNSQQQLADSLWNTINGRGPSVADIRLQQALSQGLGQTQAAGAGATGENSVLARYLAARAGGDQAAGAAQAGALLKAQETQAAQGQLGNVEAQQANEGSNMYGTNLSTGLGYSKLTNDVDQENANRAQQASAATLNALAGLGSMYFGRSPSLSVGGSPGGSGIAASYDASGGGSSLSPSAYGAGYSSAAPGFSAGRSAGPGF